MLQELICSSAELLPPASPAAAAASTDHQTNGQRHDAKDDVYRLTTEALVALHPTVVALHLFAQYEKKHKTDRTQIPLRRSTNFDTATTNTKPHADTDEYNILSDSHKSGANVRPSSLSVASSHLTQNKTYINHNHNSDGVRTRRRDHSQINGDSKNSPDNDYEPIRRPLHTSSKTKKRKIANSSKKTFGNGTDGQLIGIAEECEYDSDVAKFNCADDDQPLSPAETVDVVDDTQPTETALSHPVSLLASSTSNNNKEQLENCAELLRRSEANMRKQSTLLCLGAFVVTLVLLFLFPLPD